MRRRSASSPGGAAPPQPPAAAETTESDDSIASGPLPKDEKPDTAGSGGGGGGGGLFECNICFDIPRDPVVTQCGHLYCWGCLWRWMRQRAGASQCPVCKAPVARDTVTPIYGRGRSQGASTGSGGGGGGGEAPPRPAGHRPTTGGAGGGVSTGGPGMHPYWHPAANAYAGAHGNLALATFGNFPSLFGMEIAYPQFNEQTAEQQRLTPEQETREQVAKVFLFLALFIIVVITLF